MRVALAAVLLACLPTEAPVQQPGALSSPMGSAGEYLGELEPLEPRPGGHACLGWCRRSGVPVLIDPGQPYETDIAREDCEALLRAACEG